MNIGDTAILSSPDGGKLSIKIINFTESNTEKNWYGIGLEVKNVGEKAISGNSVRFWITDWAVVQDEAALGPRPVWDERAEHYVGIAPFYPGDSAIIIDGHKISDKSLNGKITFYYKFGENTASWIIKSS